MVVGAGERRDQRRGGHQLRPGAAVSAVTVEALYGELAERRFRQAAATLEQALRAAERADGVLGEMAVALEDAAAVIAVVAIRCDALAGVREEMDGQAGALVALAGRLEHAADLERR